MKMTLTVYLRGMECEIEGDIEPADPSVGIMSEGLGDWNFTSPLESVNWVLTEEEEEVINKAAEDWLSNYYDSYED